MQGKWVELKFSIVSDLFIRNALRELRAYYQLYSWVSV